MARPGMFKRYVSAIILLLYTVKIHFVFVFSFQLINTVFVSENNNDIWFALKKHWSL